VLEIDSKLRDHALDFLSYGVMEEGGVDSLVEAMCELLLLVST
jgi:hypothetical protein